MGDARALPGRQARWSASACRRLWRPARPLAVRCTDCAQLAQQTGDRHRRTGGPVIEDPEAASVIFKIHSTVPDMNALSVLVPAQATESQVVGLLKRLKKERLAGTLTDLIPTTTPATSWAIMRWRTSMCFPTRRMRKPIRTLSRGAHAPGGLYPDRVPFEVAMEEIRGHYRIDVNNTGAPDMGSIGFADESGVHSKHYRKIF